MHYRICISNSSYLRKFLFSLVSIGFCIAVNYSKKIAYFFFVYIAFYLQSILIAPILTRGLGVDAYGVWSQIRVSIDLLVPVCLLSLPVAFSRFSAGLKDKKEIATNYFTIQIFIICMASIVCLSFFFISDFVADKFIKTSLDVGQVVAFASLLIPIRSLCSFSTDYFRTFQHEKIFSLFMGIQSIGLVVTAYILTDLGYTLYHIIGSMIAIQLFSFIATQTIILIRIGWAKPNLKLLSSFFSFCLPLFPVSILHWVVSLSDRYVIGFFNSVTDVATYSLCYMLSMVIMFFYAPFYTILSPKLTTLWEAKQDDALQKILYFSNKVPFLISLPIITGFGILSSDILQLITGVDLVDAYILTPIICTGYLFFYVGCYYREVFILVKKTQYSTRGYMISAATNIVGNIALVPLIGILGAALVTMITFFVLMLYFMKASRRFYYIDLRWDFLWKSIWASTVMGGSVFLLKVSLFDPLNLITIALLGLSGALIYFVCLLLFSGINKQDFEVVKSLFLST